MPEVGAGTIPIHADLGPFEKGITSAMSGLSSKFGALGKVGAAGFAVVGAAAAGVGATLLKVGSSFDDAFDTIRVGTGATGKALKGLEADFKNVVKGVPTDFKSASTAIADLNTRTGQTGAGLQDLSKRMLEMTRLTGGDLSTNIASTTRLFGDWGIATEDQANTLDKLFRASQATGIGIDKLSQGMVQFGAPLRQLGFGFEQSVGLLSKFEKEGVNAELVMGSLRIALGKMARAGEPAQETLQRTVNEIKNAGSASEANALALELFGAKAGPDMAAAIREGRFELGDLLSTIESGGETILGAAADTEDFAEKWTKLKNQVFVAMEPLATKVFDALGKGLDAAVRGFGRFAEAFRSVQELGSWEAHGPFEKLGVVVAQATAGIRSLFEAFKQGGPGVQSEAAGFTGVMERIGLAARSVVDWFKANWPQIRTAIGDFIGWANAVVMPEVRKVADFLIAQFGGIVQWVKDNWPAISEAVRHVVNFMREAFERLVPVLRHHWDTMKTTIEVTIAIIKAVLETTLNIINGEWGRVWDGIKNLLASAWDGMVSIVRGGVASIVNAFLRMVEIVLEGGARMFGWVPGIGEKLREARDAFGEFKDSVNRSLRGIEDKTVTLYLTKSGQEYGPDRPGAGFATGGPVPGHGEGDTVPAWLTPGEFVIRKKAVQALGVPYLEQLNAQGYASGGLVDFNWHLPSVGGITSAAQSMFDEMAATAAASAQKAYEAEAAAAAAKRGPAGGDVGGGDYVGTTWQGITAALDRRGMDYTVTSAYRPGDPGFHGRGKAVDLVGDMANIFHTIASFSGINELFFDPIGWYLDEGSRHSGAIGGHDDHVHAATFDKGGWLQPGYTMAYNGTGKVERVSPVGDDAKFAAMVATAVAKALAENPSRSYVVATDVAKGLRDSRLR